MQIRTNKKTTARSYKPLNLVHTDIYDKIHVPYFTGEEYNITFIDDYSRYGYIYLIKEKFGALNIFKASKVEMERQLDRKIKV